MGKKETKQWVFAIGFLVCVVFAPMEARADFVGDLRLRVNEAMRQALAIREQVRRMGLAAPVEASVAVVGQKQVALQVGHWKIEEAPWELRNLDPHRQTSCAKKKKK